METQPLIELCRDLGLSEEATAVCCDVAMPQEEVRAALRWLHACPTAVFERLQSDPEGHRRALALYVRLAGLIRPAYGCWGIPDDIFRQTFSDIALWERDYTGRTGVHGLDHLPWLSNHVRMQLFRLGSLQFQTGVSLREDARRASRFQGGELALFVHIPKGTDLSAGAVRDSFCRALDFWGCNEAVLFCDSWLLGPELRNVLKPGSRILSFADEFSMVSADGLCRQAEERIFGVVRENPAEYPQGGSSLCRAARAYLMAGGRLSSAIGWKRIRRGEF